MNKRLRASIAIIMALFASVVTPLIARAEGDGFSLQVTPSPLVATLEPGKTSNLELRISNTGTSKESYRMGLRSFTVDSDTGQVDLKSDTPKDVEPFVVFDQPEFTLEPGQWINQRIAVNTPSDAGFSYSFAIMVFRKEPIDAQKSGGAAIQGSVAVFTLLNVSKSDATRKLDIVEFSSAKKVYEYLPTTLNLKIKNSGNTIVQPKGNIFISRRATDTEHIKLLQVNEANGYIIPETTRTLASTWSDGIPSYTTGSDGKQSLRWDMSKLSQLRIGKYTARAIVLYDDGTRDVPVEAVVTFWVFPWKIILGLILVLGLLVAGIWTALKNGAKVFKKKPKSDA